MEESERSQQDCNCSFSEGVCVRLIELSQQRKSLITKIHRLLCQQMVDYKACRNTLEDCSKQNNQIEAVQTVLLNSIMGNRACCRVHRKAVYNFCSSYMDQGYSEKYLNCLKQIQYRQHIQVKIRVLNEVKQKLKLSQVFFKAVIQIMRNFYKSIFQRSYLEARHSLRILQFKSRLQCLSPLVLKSLKNKYNVQSMNSLSLITKNTIVGFGQIHSTQSLQREQLLNTDHSQESACKSKPVFQRSVRNRQKYNFRTIIKYKKNDCEISKSQKKIKLPLTDRSKQEAHSKLMEQLTNRNRQVSQKIAAHICRMKPDFHKKFDFR